MLPTKLMLIWTTLSVCPLSFALNETEVDKLFADKIWNNNPHRRPVFNETDILNVSVSFDVRALVSFDESIQVIGCNGLFSIVWTDPALAWNPGSYGGVTVVTPPPNKVWRPPLVIADMLIGPQLLSDEFVSLRLNYSGEIKWTSSMVLQIFCETDMLKYPYERLLCASYLALLTYNENEVHLFPSHISLNNLVPRKQWSISNLEMIAMTVNLFGDNHSAIQISFSVFRTAYFFTFTFILPVVNLAFLGTFVFLIPATSGEKLSYAITICLSYGVYMGFLISMTPINSGLSAFTIFLTLCVVLSSVYTILSITSVNLSTRIDEVFPVSERLAKCVIFAEKLLRMKGQAGPRRNTHRQVSPTPSSILDDDIYQDRGDSRVTWNRVSRAMDKICFVVFFSLVSLVMTGLMIITFK